LRRYVSSPLAPVLVIAVAVRMCGLDYNGAFIDESFYSQVMALGNVPYITGNAFVWPFISARAHAIGGVETARAVAGLFGVATTAFVYGIARSWAAFFGEKDRAAQAATVAALIFTLSPPALVTSQMATYDAMAFLLFALGFWLFLRGFEGKAVIRWPLAAAAFTLAAITRYFLFGYLIFFMVPYALYRASSERPHWKMLLFFLVPLGLFAGGYHLQMGDHVWAAIANAGQTAAAHSTGRSRDLTRIAATLGTGVLLIAGGRLARGLPRRTAGSVFAVALAAALPLIYHGLTGHYLTIEKNLVMTVLFGSILFAIPLVQSEALQRLWRTRVWPRALSVTLLGLLIAAQAAGPGRTVMKTWPDWRPVVTAAQQPDMPEGAVWVTASSGDPILTGGNVWLLRQMMGSRVNEASPWLEANPDLILERADRENIPIVIGPFPGRGFKEGDRVLGYRVKQVVKVRYGPDAFILVRNTPVEILA
jgi:hypothetical protein